MKRIYTNLGRLEREMKVFFDNHKGLVEFAKAIREHFTDKIDIQIGEHYNAVLPLTAETISGIWQALATYREVEWSSFHYLYYTNANRNELVNLKDHIPLTTMEVYWKTCDSLEGSILKATANAMQESAEKNLAECQPTKRSINMSAWNDNFHVSEPGLLFGKDGKIVPLIERGITTHADGSLSGVVVEGGVETFVHVQECQLGKRFGSSETKDNYDVGQDQQDGYSK